MIIKLNLTVTSKDKVLVNIIIKKVKFNQIELKTLFFKKPTNLWFCKCNHQDWLLHYNSTYREALFDELENLLFSNNIIKANEIIEELNQLKI
jgi:hypothetical protein